MNFLRLLLLPVLTLCSFRILAQDADEKFISNALNERRIVRNDTVAIFFVAAEEKVVRPDASKNYYWFNRDSILVTTGGFGGRVLDGEYKVYYPNKSLRESGRFYNGLKDGDWKTWNPNGSLRQIVHWKKGDEQ